MLFFILTVCFLAFSVCFFMFYRNRRVFRMSKIWGDMVYGYNIAKLNNRLAITEEKNLYSYFNYNKIMTKDLFNFDLRSLVGEEVYDRVAGDQR